MEWYPQGTLTQSKILNSRHFCNVWQRAKPAHCQRNLAHCEVLDVDAAVHDIRRGRVQLFRRARSAFWQCRASVGGKQYRSRTKEESLAKAKDVADGWNLTLKGKIFKQAAERFINEFEIVAQGERSPLGGESAAAYR